MKIAITGKGGVGKTTISSILARTFASQGKNVLAIDADPNGNLPEAVGYDMEVSGRLKPLIEERETIKERTGEAPGESFGGVFRLTPKVDDFVEMFAKEVNDLRVMVTGELREALTGCYCPENSILRAFIRHLFVDRDEWVILDMEAGFEHLTRGTAESVDLLLIVMEPGMRSIRTAQKIVTLSQQIGIKRKGFIINKLHDDEELGIVTDIFGEDRVWLSLPFDTSAVKADLSGQSPFDTCKAIKEPVGELAKRLEELEQELAKV